MSVPIHERSWFPLAVILLMVATVLGVSYQSARASARTSQTKRQFHSLYNQIQLGQSIDAARTLTAQDEYSALRIIDNSTTFRVESPFPYFAGYRHKGAPPVESWALECDYIDGTVSAVRLRTLSGETIPNAVPDKGPQKNQHALSK